MGYYVETGKSFGKADSIVSDYGGTKVSKNKAAEAMADGNVAVICIKRVRDNGFFEEAGFCYNQAEFDVFADPGDFRYTQWILMDREKAK